MNKKEEAIKKAQHLGFSGKTFKNALKYLKNIKSKDRIIRTQKHTAKPKHRQYIRLLNAIILVPLSDKHKDQLLSLQKSLHRRRQNWNTPEPVNADNTCDTRTNNHGKYSSRCTYDKKSYTPIITSYVIVQRNDKTIKFWFDNAKPRTINAPRGYRWKRDQNGLALCANKNQELDYHVNSSDLTDYKPMDLTRKLRSLAAARRDIKRKLRNDKAAMKKAIKTGLRVCYRDSVNAGNCSIGTRAFAIRNKINTKKHYHAKLFSNVKDNFERVQLVLLVALKRHTQELAQGFSVLSDHRE